jgi:MFS family permease
MIFSVLPAFITEELGVSHSKLGVIEGVALSLAFLAKVFSGVLSDALGSRKSLLFLGSLLTTLSKPFFALSTSAYHIFWTRSLDRIGKGIRSSPTDALIADLSEATVYSGTYGMRQAYYTIGAIAGSLLALFILEEWSGNFRLLFHLAILPSLAGLLLIHCGLQKYYDGKPSKNSRAHGLPLATIVKQARALPSRFWFLMVVVGFLMLARFSEAFLSLRARELGLPLAKLPLIIIIMDVVHATVAVPFGRWADRYEREKVLLGGLLVQCVSAGLLYLSSSLTAVFIATVMVGFYMGITQGVLRAMVASASPAQLRGTAFAIFYLVSGVGVLLGNSYCGFASDCWGMPAIFAGGAICTAISIGFHHLFTERYQSTASSVSSTPTC